MKFNKKKGFTIVELVIVIAIIAILAAVLIPTFASLIRKANESADIQAVRQMNSYLATYKVPAIESIDEVYKAFEEGNMTAKDYRPLVSGRYFFWDKELNRVVYTDSEYKVLFPEENKGRTNKDLNHQWLSLSGVINTKEVTVTEDTTTKGTYTVNITSAEELYWLSQNYEKNDWKNLTVNLTKDIDLMGADVAFTVTYEKNQKAFTLSGPESGMAVITGLAQSQSKAVGLVGTAYEGKNYASGLIAKANGVTVSVKNITIKDAVIGDLETGSVGAVIGANYGSKITLENVKVENTIINGKNKVGGFIGLNRSDNETTIDSNCSLSNVTINCSEGEAGKIIGAITAETGNTATNLPADFDVSTVKLNLVEGAYKRATISSADGKYTAVAKLSKEGVHEESGKAYRVFCADALYNIGTCKKGDKTYTATVTVGTETKTYTTSADYVKASAFGNSSDITLSPALPITK